VDFLKDNNYKLSNLNSFSFLEKDSDKGETIREKSRAICDLIGDKKKILEEREKYKSWKGRIGSVGSGSVSSGSNSNRYGSSSSSGNYNTGNKNFGAVSSANYQASSSNRSEKEKTSTSKKNEKESESSSEDEKDKKKKKKEEKKTVKEESESSEEDEKDKKKPSKKKKQLKEESESSEDEKPKPNAKNTQTSKTENVEKKLNKLNLASDSKFVFIKLALISKNLLLQKKKIINKLLITIIHQETYWTSMKVNLFQQPITTLVITLIVI